MERKTIFSGITTPDVFNFVENKSMELRFEKKWTEFFHEFKKTIAVDDLKESTLVQGFTVMIF